MKKNRIRKSKYSYLRYGVLTSVILFFFLIPLSNWYANNKIAYNQAHLVGLASGPIAEIAYASFDGFYSLWEDPVTAATSNNGSLWAFTILGVPLSDPLGLISEIVNSVKFPVKYLIGGFIPFLVAIFLGRVFCAWLCPMVVLYSITGKVRAYLLRLKVPLLTLSLERSTRVFVFWGGLILAHFFGAWVWHFILPYISFTHEIFSMIVFSSFTVGIYFLIALLVLDIGLIPGEFCNSVCPTGFLLSYIGKFSLLRLNAKKENCPVGCTNCKKVCPINLYPKEGDLYSCHLCLKCVDNCPKKHILLTTNPIYSSLIKKIKSGISRRLFGVGIFFLLLFQLPNAFSHHYKGLPHYSYFDNYPQSPYLEFIKETKDYEVFITVYNFQGLNLDQVESPDIVRLYIYMFDINEDKIYKGKASFKILSHGQQIFEVKDLPSEQENIFSIQKKIEQQDDLLLQIEFQSKNGVNNKIDIPFQITKTFFEQYGVYVSVAFFFFVVIGMKMVINKVNLLKVQKNG